MGQASGVTPYLGAKRTGRRNSGTSFNFLSRLVVASGESLDARVGLTPLGEEEQDEFQEWDFNPVTFRNITGVLFVGNLMFTVSFFSFYGLDPPTTIPYPQSHIHC